jgi:hypothetical protein
MTRKILLSLLVLCAACSLPPAGPDEDQSDLAAPAVGGENDRVNRGNGNRPHPDDWDPEWGRKP